MLRPLLNLLRAAEDEARKRGLPREALLRQAGVTEVRFNAFVGRRERPTYVEIEGLVRLLALPRWFLLQPAPCAPHERAILN